MYNAEDCENHRLELVNRVCDRVWAGKALWLRLEKDHSFVNEMCG